MTWGLAHDGARLRWREWSCTPLQLAPRKKELKTHLVEPVNMKLEYLGFPKRLSAKSSQCIFLKDIYSNSDFLMRKAKPDWE